MGVGQETVQNTAALDITISLILSDVFHHHPICRFRDGETTQVDHWQDNWCGGKQ